MGLKFYWGPEGSLNIGDCPEIEGCYEADPETIVRNYNTLRDCVLLCECNLSGEK